MGLQRKGRHHLACSCMVVSFFADKPWSSSVPKMILGLRMEKAVWLLYGANATHEQIANGTELNQRGFETHLPRSGKDHYWGHRGLNGIAMESLETLAGAEVVAILQPFKLCSRELQSTTL